MAKSLLVKARLSIDGLVEGSIVYGWLIPGRLRNGHLMPLMTEAQLDALIAAQDPALSAERGEVDKVFFDKQEGYCVQNTFGDCEKLDKTTFVTPEGEILYNLDTEAGWTWELADVGR